MGKALGNYVIFYGNKRSEFCILDFMEGFDDDYKLMKGYALSEEWPDNVKFPMNPAYDKRLKLSDHLINRGNVIIASPRLQAFLKKEAVPNIEFLPVKIINHKKRVESTEYTIANLVTTQDCLDQKASKVNWNSITPDDVSGLKRLVLDESKIDKDATIFRAKHMKVPIFVRRDLAKKFVDEGLTGMAFKELSEYE